MIQGGAEGAKGAKGGKHKARGVVPWGGPFFVVWGPHAAVLQGPP